MSLLKQIRDMNLIIEPVKTTIRRVSGRMMQRTSSQLQPEVSACVEDYVKSLTSSLRGIGNDWLNENDALEVVPTGTKLLRKYGQGALIVVEQPPAVRTVEFNSKKGHGFFGLAFPYVIFAIHLFKDCATPTIRVAFANKSITSLQSKVYTPVLPNHTRTLCMDVETSWGQTLAQNVNHIIEKFWNTSFNNDMADNFVDFSWQDRRFVDLHAWECHSKENPLFVLNVNWPAECTVEALVKTDRRVGISLAVNAPDEVVAKSALRVRKVLEESEKWMLKDKDVRNSLADFQTELENQIYQILQAYDDEKKKISDNHLNERLRLKDEIKRLKREHRNPPRKDEDEHEPGYIKKKWYNCNEDVW